MDGWQNWSPSSYLEQFLMVADRMVRDQRLGMAELQRATSEGYPVYVLGKFIGNFVAMLVPAFVVLMSCGLALALCCWWWLQREERLLGNLR